MVLVFQRESYQDLSNSKAARSQLTDKQKSFPYFLMGGYTSVFISEESELKIPLEDTGYGRGVFQTSRVRAADDPNLTGDSMLVTIAVPLEQFMDKIAETICYHSGPDPLMSRTTRVTLSEEIDRFRRHGGIMSYSRVSFNWGENEEDLLLKHSLIICKPAKDGNYSEILYVGQEFERLYPEAVAEVKNSIGGEIRAKENKPPLK
ncbi:MAG: hypothetical protein JNK26_03550 [Candidatus Doudnabacteria bacterium]|nr:hypothetical protein [Candidatus Doudnabacteria bacterium]